METISRLVLTFVLNAAWQVVLIMVVAVLGDRLLRRTSSRYRHRLWVAALFLSWGLSIYSISPIFRNAFSPGEPVSGELMLAPILTPSQSNPVVISAPEAASEAVQPQEPVLREPIRIIEVDRKAAAVLIALYLLSCCYYGLRLLKAWQRTSAIRRSVYSIEDQDDVRAIIGRCQEALEVKEVGLRCSSEITTPITVGSLNPLIVVPEHLLREADAELLTSAIGHELAHVSRHDYLFNLIYELISLPLLFHPAAGLMRRRIAQTRELGCDELVVERLLKANVYARSLVRLAGSAIAPSRPYPTVTLGITDPGILEERIMTILRRPRISVRRKNLLLVAAVLVLAVPCAAAASYSRSVGLALQDDHAKPAAEGKGAGKDEAGMQSGATRPQGPEESRAPKTGVKPQRKVAQKVDQHAAAGQAASGATDRRSEAEIRAEISQKQFFTVLDLNRAQSVLNGREVIVRKQAIQAELARKATVSLQQAIQTATDQVPGRVINGTLWREQEKILYCIRILPEDSSTNATTDVLVDAIGGQIVRIDKDLVISEVKLHLKYEAPRILFIK